eukprot:731539-Hanusia_phi.AAC.1
MLTVSLIQQQGGQLAGTYEGDFTNGALVLNLTEAVAGGDISTVSFTFGLQNPDYNPGCYNPTITIGLSKNGVSASQERTVTVDRTAKLYKMNDLTSITSWTTDRVTGSYVPKDDDACPLHIASFAFSYYNVYPSSTNPCASDTVTLSFSTTTPVFGQCKNQEYSRITVTGLDLFQSNATLDQPTLIGSVEGGYSIDWTGLTGILIDPDYRSWLKAYEPYNITFTRLNRNDVP